MSSFKKFNIQWAWLVNKRGFNSAMLIMSIILVLACIGVAVFAFGFLYNQKGERIISNNSIQIIGGISALVFFYLYSICGIYGNTSKNFKIAINKAEKFVVENPQCRPNINIFIEGTRGTKNPTRLNEWIDNWRKLSSTKAYLQGLEKEKEDIEKGILLNKVNAKIETEKERIKELESELF